LPLAYRLHEENSGLALRLAWRVLDEADGHGWRPSPAWLTAEKLRTLGFDLPDNTAPRSDDRYAPAPLPRKVFIVLEQDGPSRRKALERAAKALATARDLKQAHPENEDLHEAFEAARKRFAHEQVAASRLFAVDAAADPEALRKIYSDRSRFIIAAGLVRAGYRYEGNQWRVNGTISRLVIERIHVPLVLRQPLDTILDRDRLKTKAPAPPRYEVVLAYGRRFEPWIVSVAPAPLQRPPENG
jgi:hypothetical protein